MTESSRSRVADMLLGSPCMNLSLARRPIANRHIRIDEMGRAQAIQYSDLNYSPREGEVRTYLTDWANYRYTINRFGAKEDRASCTWEKCSRSGTGFVEVGIYRASSRTAGAVGFGFSVSSHAEGVAVGRVPHASSS
jgi:hypothetical protein